MADWYLSSVAYALVAQFAISHPYNVGDIIRPLATPAYGSEHCFRCTTAGTSAGSEPAWSPANNTTTTTGGATFTNVTGQSTYGWAAAAGTTAAIDGIGVASSRIVAGDRVYTSSDHSQSRAGAITLNGNITSALTLPPLYLSVNRAGSVPPVAADILVGATITTTGSSNVTFESSLLCQGFTFSSAGSIIFNNATTNGTALKNCGLVLTGTATGAKITAANPGRISWDNTTVTFGAVGQYIGSSGFSFNLDWFNTPNALQGATIPTNVFSTPSATAMVNVTCRGVDFSAMTSGKALVDMVAADSVNRYLFANCKLSATANITNGTPTSDGAIVELINCDSGNTNYRSEKHTSAGDLTTETSIVLTGGSSDGTTTISRKMVSSSRANARVLPLEGFTIDQWNTAIGSPQTATVEIISSGTLTNAEAYLKLEYPGDASFPISSFVDNYLATPVTAATNQTSSTATWTASPATPVKQKLEVTYTPQKVGLVRATVILGKPSTTIYYNPRMTIV